VTAVVTAVVTAAVYSEETAQQTVSSVSVSAALHSVGRTAVVWDFFVLQDSSIWIPQSPRVQY